MRLLINNLKTMTGGMNKSTNQLARMRHKRNLTQKALAYALGHSTPDQVSRYENSGHLPTLEAAMKLEILLRAPIRMLFAELHAQVKEEIREQLKASPHLSMAIGEFYQPDYCVYEELLTGADLSIEVHDKVHRHAASLINKMNLGSQLREESVNE